MLPFRTEDAPCPAWFDLLPRLKPWDSSVSYPADNCGCDRAGLLRQFRPSQRRLRWVGYPLSVARSLRDRDRDRERERERERGTHGRPDSRLISLTPSVHPPQGSQLGRQCVLLVGGGV